MARLIDSDTSRLSSVTSQLSAIVEVRCRLWVNALRRKGGTSEFVARILFLPLFAIFGLAPTIGSGAAAWFIFKHNALSSLPLLMWAIFGVWFFIGINAAAGTTGLDLRMLVRFPIRFPTYLIVRLIFGALDMQTVIGLLCLLSAAIGIGLARPSLFPWAALVFFAFALANIFFFRMIYAWVDRWLAQRRTREIVTCLFLLFPLTLQILGTYHRNLVRDAAPYLQHAQIPFLLRFMSGLKQATHFLPPGLAASSIVSISSAQPLSAISSLFALSAFAALFLAIFGWRLYYELEGETFSETAVPSTTTAVHNRQGRVRWNLFGLPPTIAACIEKEIRYIARSGPLLFNFVTPLFMILVLNRPNGLLHRGMWGFPGAMAYTLLVISGLLYNTLGADGAGVQLYFLAPIKLREIIIAKNLVNLTLLAIEMLLVGILFSYLNRPPTLTLAIATLCWVVFATLTNMSVGNLRSIYAPKHYELGKVRRQATSQLSALISLGVLFGTVLFGGLTLALCLYLGHAWLSIPIFLTLSVAAFIFYLQVINHIDAVAMDRRELMAEELCKAA
jgi:ABC-2 type transport system permease protein